SRDRSMTHKAKATLLLSLTLAACTQGGTASLRIDTSAIQALRSGIDPTSGHLQVSCADGRSEDIPLTVEDTNVPIDIVVPACGEARLDFTLLSTLSIAEIAGSADTVLRPGFNQVDIPIRTVGQLTVGLDPAASADNCIATVERTTPDQEVIS